MPVGKRAARPATADQVTSASGTATTPGHDPKSTGSLATSGTCSAPKSRVIYRDLEVRGLTSDEAARLTAFLHGLPTTDLGWSLQQLNRLLFLRRLREAGAFDGRAIHPS